MTVRDSLVEQHILLHESRLRHVDEVLDRARQIVSKMPAASAFQQELDELRIDRERYLAHISELKRQAREEWQEETIEQAGPMIVWEAVAKKLEKLIEKFDRR